ncbi:trypsin-3-like [Bacillus rossius redtenbacheri]|uniref:trypsin-3-like n=1 Tax=Bacillus rossius redtenbacheri TaxID=93214 RepID=UPI002FDDC66B
MSPIAVLMSLLAFSLAYPQHNGLLNQRKYDLGGRIVGGNATTIEEFPYMVSVRENYEGLFESHICGGSIISENFVVTAGHCCADEDTASLVVRVGSTKAKIGEKHELSEIILHPEYKQVDRVPYNDICLLKVSKPFVYSDSIKAVALPQANSEVPEGTLAVTSGWGSTFYEGDVVQVLREVAVPIVSQAACVSEYGKNIHGDYMVNDTMICAGYLQGGKDACQGDSGGPLTVGGSLVGLVSWSVGCAEPKYATVFTNVARFRDWVKSEAGV